MLGSEDLLIHLATHGSRHAWRRLSWLAEFSALIPRTSKDAWRRVWESAARDDVDRPVGQALQISRQLFDTPIPGEAKRRVMDTRAMRGLARRAFSEMAAEEGTGPSGVRATFSEMFSYRARLGHSRAYRVRFLSTLLLAGGDIYDVALPDRLVWLYCFLRPVLWVRRLFR